MAHTVSVPIELVNKLHELVVQLEQSLSPHRPEFLARMYRARASDLEGKGRTLADVKKKLAKS